MVCRKLEAKVICVVKQACGNNISAEVFDWKNKIHTYNAPPCLKFECTFKSNDIRALGKFLESPSTY